MAVILTISKLNMLCLRWQWTDYCVVLYSCLSDVHLALNNAVVTTKWTTTVIHFSCCICVPFSFNTVLCFCLRLHADDVYDSFVFYQEVHNGALSVVTCPAFQWHWLQNKNYPSRSNTTNFITGDNVLRRNGPKPNQRQLDVSFADC